MHTTSNMLLSQEYLGLNNATPNFQSTVLGARTDVDRKKKMIIQQKKDLVYLVLALNWQGYNVNCFRDKCDKNTITIIKQYLENK